MFGARPGVTVHLGKEFKKTAGCPHHRGLVECHIGTRLALWLALSATSLYHRTAGHRASLHALVRSDTFSSCAHMSFRLLLGPCP